MILKSVSVKKTFFFFNFFSVNMSVFDSLNESDDFLNEFYWTKNALASIRQQMSHILVQNTWCLVRIYCYLSGTNRYVMFLIISQPDLKYYF